MIQRWTPGQVLKQQVDRTLSLLSQSRTGKLNVTMSPTLSSPSYELRNHRSFRHPTSSAMNGLLPVKNTVSVACFVWAMVFSCYKWTANR